MFPGQTKKFVNVIVSVCTCVLFMHVNVYAEDHSSAYYHHLNYQRTRRRHAWLHENRRLVLKTPNFFSDRQIIDFRLTYHYQGNCF